MVFFGGVICEAGHNFSTYAGDNVSEIYVFPAVCFA